MYGVPSNEPRASFPFGNCVAKRLIFWDEPNINEQNLEQVKLIFGGAKCLAEVKYKNETWIERTPVICCSNREPGKGMCDRDIFKNRAFILKLTKPMDSSESLDFNSDDWCHFFTSCKEEQCNLNILNGKK